MALDHTVIQSSLILLIVSVCDIGTCILTKLNGIFYLDVYLSLNGEIVFNHGYVLINNIGSNGNTGTPLICNTNRPPPSGKLHSGGDWISPSDVTVGYTNTATVPGFGRNRGPMVVRLWRITVSTDSPVEGIYRCEVKDATEMLQSVYVGLYNDGGGMIIFV